jgi:cytochrome c oxidase subunit 3
MVFISFTSAYIVRQGLPTFDARSNSLVRDWLPVRLPGILLVNTFVLLVSSMTMEMARRHVTRTAELARNTFAHELSLGPSTILWLAVTFVLGLTFLRGQWMAWRQLTVTGFDVASSPSSSFVYVLTGMHGLHLLGGILVLLIAVSATLLRRPFQSQRVILDVTGWYWHSMALLWIYILCLLKFIQ